MSARAKYWILLGMFAAIFTLNWDKIGTGFYDALTSFISPGETSAESWPGKFDILLSYVGGPVFFLGILLFRSKTRSILGRTHKLVFLLVLCAIPVVFAPMSSSITPNEMGFSSGENLLPPLSNTKFLVRRGVDSSIVQYMQFDNFKLRSGRLIAFSQSGEFEIAKSRFLFEFDEPVVVEHFHLLGTDEFGRDVYSRIIFGARVSFSIALLSVGLSIFIGMVLGFLGGFWGNAADVILSRMTEMFLAFPTIFLVILALLLFGSNFWTIVIILGLSGWMSIFKIVKDKTVDEKNKEYFITSASLGFSKTHLLLKELMPAVIPHLTTAALFQFGNVILAESALNFLGLGFGPDIPSWGSLIRSGQMYITQGWWLILFPGLAIVLSLIFINFAARKLVIRINPQFE